MMSLNLFQLVDAAFDNLARRLAQNLSSNIETVAQNRAARESSELSDQQLHQRAVVREKSKQGNEVYSRKSAYSQLSQEDSEKLFECLMADSDYKLEGKMLFIA